MIIEEEFAITRVKPDFAKEVTAHPRWFDFSGERATFHPHALVPCLETGVTAQDAAAETKRH
jgi:hypothetical protein